MRKARRASASARTRDSDCRVASYLSSQCSTTCHTLSDSKSPPGDRPILADRVAIVVRPRGGQECQHEEKKMKDRKMP
jgi:hypothetical protein